MAHRVGIEPTYGFPLRLTAGCLASRLPVNVVGRRTHPKRVDVRPAPAEGIEPPSSRETAERPPLDFTGMSPRGWH